MRLNVQFMTLLWLQRMYLEKPAIVAGGGSPESFTAGKLRDWTRYISGREQLAAEKFAEALEVIPLTLAENAGMDPIDSYDRITFKADQRFQNRRN